MPNHSKRNKWWNVCIIIGMYSFIKFNNNIVTYSHSCCDDVSLIMTLKGPFYSHGRSLIPGSWIIDIHIPRKVLGEIPCPFPNFNGCTLEVSNGEVISPYILYWMQVSKLEFKSNHGSERGPRIQSVYHIYVNLSYDIIMLSRRNEYSLD